MVRKVGENIQRLPYMATLTRISIGKLGMTIPGPLLRLLGLRKGQRFKVKATAGKLTLTIRRTSKAPYRKRSGAERVRFDSEWYRLVKALSKRKQRRAP